MKTRRIIGWILVVCVAAILLLAGSAKLFGLIPMDEVEKMGLAEEIRLIGFGAIVSAVLFAIPRTSSIGVLLVSSYWGGAICTHMIKGDPYFVPAILLLISWTATGLRDCRMLWSFCSNPNNNKQAEID